MEIAKLVSHNLRISRKFSVELCNLLRYKDVNRAEKMLEQIIAKQLPVPLKRYNRDVGHKKGKGIAAGRYPIKAAETILKLLRSAKANAENKGMNVENLYIARMVANKGNTRWHFGRHRRRKMKSTHIEIELAEKQITKK